MTVERTPGTGGSNNHSVISEVEVKASQDQPVKPGKDAPTVSVLSTSDASVSAKAPEKTLDSRAVDRLSGIPRAPEAIIKARQTELAHLVKALETNVSAADQFCSRLNTMHGQDIIKVLCKTMEGGPSYKPQSSTGIIHLICDGSDHAVTAALQSLNRALLESELNHSDIYKLLDSNIADFMGGKARKFPLAQQAYLSLLETMSSSPEGANQVASLLKKTEYGVYLYSATGAYDSAIKTADCLNQYAGLLQTLSSYSDLKSTVNTLSMAVTQRAMKRDSLNAAFVHKFLQLNSPSQREVLLLSWLYATKPGRYADTHGAVSTTKIARLIQMEYGNQDGFNLHSWIGRVAKKASAPGSDIKVPEALAKHLDKIAAKNPSDLFQKAIAEIQGKVDRLQKNQRKANQDVPATDYRAGIINEQPPAETPYPVTSVWTEEDAKTVKQLVDIASGEQFELIEKAVLAASTAKAQPALSAGISTAVLNEFGVANHYELVAYLQNYMLLSRGRLIGDKRKEEMLKAIEGNLDKAWQLVSNQSPKHDLARVDKTLAFSAITKALSPFVDKGDELDSVTNVVFSSSGDALSVALVQASGEKRSYNLSAEADTDALNKVLSVYDSGLSIPLPAGVTLSIHKKSSGQCKITHDLSLGQLSEMTILPGAGKFNIEHDNCSDMRIVETAQGTFLGYGFNDEKKCLFVSGITGQKLRQSLGDKFQQIPIEQDYEGLGRRTRLELDFDQNEFLLGTRAKVRSTVNSGLLSKFSTWLNGPPPELNTQMVLDALNKNNLKLKDIPDADGLLTRGKCYGLCSLYGAVAAKHGSEKASDYFRVLARVADIEDGQVPSDLKSMASQGLHLRDLEQAFYVDFLEQNKEAVVRPIYEMHLCQPRYFPAKPEVQTNRALRYGVKIEENKEIKNTDQLVEWVSASGRYENNGADHLVFNIHNHAMAVSRSKDLETGKDLFIFYDPNEGCKYISTDIGKFKTDVDYHLFDKYYAKANNVTGQKKKVCLEAIELGVKREPIPLKSCSKVVEADNSRAEEFPLFKKGQDPRLAFNHWLADNKASFKLNVDGHAITFKAEKVGDKLQLNPTCEGKEYSPYVFADWENNPQLVEQFQALLQIRYHSNDQQLSAVLKSHDTGEPLTVSDEEGVEIAEEAFEYIDDGIVTRAELEQANKEYLQQRYVGPSSLRAATHEDVDVEQWPPLDLQVRQVSNSTSQYDSNIIIQLSSDDIVKQAVENLYQKHPGTTQVVQWDGKDHKVIGDLAKVKGNVRIRLVGHGTDMEGDRATTLAGMSPVAMSDGLTALLGELSTAWGQSAYLGKIAVKGCGLAIEGESDASYADALQQNLQDYGVTVPVSAFQTDMDIGPDGRSVVRVDGQWHGDKVQKQAQKINQVAVAQELRLMGKKAEVGDKLKALDDKQKKAETPQKAPSAGVQIANILFRHAIELNRQWLAEQEHRKQERRAEDEAKKAEWEARRQQLYAEKEQRQQESRAMFERFSYGVSGFVQESRRSAQRFTSTVVQQPVKTTSSTSTASSTAAKETPSNTSQSTIQHDGHIYSNSASSAYMQAQGSTPARSTPAASIPTPAAAPTRTPAAVSSAPAPVAPAPSAQPALPVLPNVPTHEPGSSSSRPSRSGRRREGPQRS